MAQGSIQLVPVVQGLRSPVFLTSARDGSRRIFIVEQPGRILVMLPGSTAPLNKPFLDIEFKVVSGGEMGLLGLAFHPQFASNRRFFVNYTRGADGATVVSEFKASATAPNEAETAEKILLAVQQPYSNHNGGMIDFGPDGFLYIGMGDGGSGNDPGNHAQNINSLLGKMLRIDVDTPNGNVPYSSPSTNPFFGGIDGADEIYATGLRNPWRWSFDRQTGELYAGDVGQGQREEISIITLGGNYGWRVLEGTRCTNLGPASCTAEGFIPPLIEYSHTGNRCSVTGGYVYRGSRATFPPDSYVYADFCTGEIFLWDDNSTSTLIDTDLPIASFGEDEAGEIYVISLSGSIFRLAGSTDAALVSAANYRGDNLASESIVAAFGSGLSAGTGIAQSDQPLPTSLAGTSIQIVDALGATRFAPLFYVSPTQANFQIPPGTVSGSATIIVLSDDLFGVAATSTTNIVDVVPSVFAANANGRGLAAAVIQRTRADGTQSFESVAVFDNSATQFVPVPIDLGAETDQVFLILFGTGFRFRSALSNVSARVGGSTMQVTFAGSQGVLIGLDQANIRLERALAGRGTVDVILTVDGMAANTVQVNIK